MQSTTKKLSLLDAIIQVESGGNDNLTGDTGLKNHSFGCLQIRQGLCDYLNSKLKTNYQAKNCLGNRTLSIEIWNKYWPLWPSIVTDEDKARAWNGGAGWKKIYNMKIKTPAQSRYCQNLDIYWNKVKPLL